MQQPTRDLANGVINAQVDQLRVPVHAEGSAIRGPQRRGHAESGADHRIVPVDGIGVFRRKRSEDAGVEHGGSVVQSRGDPELEPSIRGVVGVRLHRRMCAGDHRGDRHYLRRRAEDERVYIGDRVAQAAERIGGEVAVSGDRVADGGVGELKQDRPAAAGEEGGFASEVGEEHSSLCVLWLYAARLALSVPLMGGQVRFVGVDDRRPYEHRKNPESFTGRAAPAE